MSKIGTGPKLKKMRTKEPGESNGLELMMSYWLHVTCVPSKLLIWISYIIDAIIASVIASKQIGRNLHMIFIDRLFACYV